MKAVFFDRDGVINEDAGYLYKREDFIWTDGAKDTFAHLHNLGYAAFVVTNQSGVARGYYTEEKSKRFIIVPTWKEQLLPLMIVKVHGASPNRV